MLLKHSEGAVQGSPVVLRQVLVPSASGSAHALLAQSGFDMHVVFNACLHAPVPLQVTPSAPKQVWLLLAEVSSWYLAMFWH